MPSCWGIVNLCMGPPEFSPLSDNSSHPTHLVRFRWEYTISFHTFSSFTSMSFYFCIILLPCHFTRVQVGVYHLISRFNLTSISFYSGSGGSILFHFTFSFHLLPHHFKFTKINIVQLMYSQCHIMIPICLHQRRALYTLSDLFSPSLYMLMLNAAVVLGRFEVDQVWSCMFILCHLKKGRASCPWA